jgi:hypothetical protein
MTRYRELVELRTRVRAVLVTLEAVAGSAPDFVRRFDRSGKRDAPSFRDLYFGIKELGESADDEAGALSRAGKEHDD